MTPNRAEHDKNDFFRLCPLCKRWLLTIIRVNLEIREDVYGSSFDFELDLSICSMLLFKLQCLQLEVLQLLSLWSHRRQLIHKFFDLQNSNRLWAFNLMNSGHANIFWLPEHMTHFKILSVATNDRLISFFTNLFLLKVFVSSIASRILHFFSKNSFMYLNVGNIMLK